MLPHLLPVTILWGRIMAPVFKLIFLMFLFIFETERDRAWAGEGQREGDTESETGSRLWAVSTEPDTGLELTDCEIMTWAEVGPLTDWATQAPQKTSFNTHKNIIVGYIYMFNFIRQRMQELKGKRG